MSDKNWWARRAGVAPVAPVPPVSVGTVGTPNYQPAYQPGPISGMAPTQQVPTLSLQSQKRQQVSMSEALASTDWRPTMAANQGGRCPACGGGNLFDRAPAASLCYDCGYNGRYVPGSSAPLG